MRITQHFFAVLEPYNGKVTSVDHEVFAYEDYGLALTGSLCLASMDSFFLVVQVVDINVHK